MKENLFKQEDLRAKLAGGGYRTTPQRKAILRIFTENPCCRHLSAEEVAEALWKKHPEIGLTTIYRNLELLSKLDILVRVDFGDGRGRYELNTDDPGDHHHHHLICTKCGKITEFEGDFLEDLEFKIFDKSGFKVANHELKVFGTCRECRAKEGRGRANKNA